MSRAFREVTYPARTEEVVSKRCCDQCHKTIGGVDHVHDQYEVQEVTIQCEVGARWPDSASVKIVEVDCCVDCFKKIVRPALEALHFGFYKHSEEW